MRGGCEGEGVRGGCVRGVYVLMRDEEGRKKEASKVIHTDNKAKQHSTPKSLFLRKNELPQVGFKPTTLDIALNHRATENMCVCMYMYMYSGYTGDKKRKH